MSFLQLEGCHVLVTGASGGIGSAIVDELLSLGCTVSGLDLVSVPSDTRSHPRFLSVTADITDESSLLEAFTQIRSKFGVPNTLVANAGITDESHAYPIWEMPTSLWDKVYNVNVRGTFLTVKTFLAQISAEQERLQKPMDNVSIVIMGSECGKFGQAGHGEYASGKAALQYGLVRTLKNEIVRLNASARINAVAPGWVATPLIGDRLDDPRELWLEAQATVPLRKVAKPEDVARLTAFLLSHRAAGHISGECISVDGGMEGRVVWPQA